MTSVTARVTTEPPASDPRGPASRVSEFPRLRYMGSKYRLVPYLAEVFTELGGGTALDAFSGSGVVSYLLKTLGHQVTTNDFLTFPTSIAQATVVNQEESLSAKDIEEICGPSADDRDFIRRTFKGLYFTDDDREFLDSAWSHIDRMSGHKQAVAISALVLASARRQPRGVFTFTDLRYDDVYLDPPYAPPRDDNCYIKRYHFLEGLSVYWRGQTIMENTRTKKLAKRYTPFSYKHTVTDALRRTFKQFQDSTIVLSYSSNAVPDAATIEALLREVKDNVEVRLTDHTYTFGTHSAAQRRAVSEYLFIGR